MLRCLRNQQEWVVKPLGTGSPKKSFFSQDGNKCDSARKQRRTICHCREAWIREKHANWVAGFGFAQEPNSQGTTSRRNGQNSNVLTRSCDGQSFGAHLEVRRKTDPDAPNIESHSMTLTCECLWKSFSLCAVMDTRFNSGMWRPDQERTTTFRQNAVWWNPSRIACSLGAVVQEGHFPRDSQRYWIWDVRFGFVCSGIEGVTTSL